MKLTMTADRLWTELDDDEREDLTDWLADELGYLCTEVDTVAVIGEGRIELRHLIVDDDADAFEYYKVDADGELEFITTEFDVASPPPHLARFVAEC